MREERGAIGVIFSILLVAIFSMVAIVIDLGAARLTVRDNQSIADFAALAGGSRLPNAPRAACEDAWRYVKSNASGMPATANMDCNQFPAVCQSSTPARPPVISTGAGTYVVRFTYPVPDADLVPTRILDGVTATPNQHQCERMKVEIENARPSFFHGVVGGGFTRLSSSAVVRSVFGTTNPTLVPLVILDPFGCNALTASGQGAILVHESGGVPSVPGKIGIDSSGTLTSTQNTLGPPARACGGNNTYVLDAAGVQNSQIKAFPTSDGSQPGAIAMFGLARGQNTCTTSTNDPPVLTICDQTDINNGRVDPMPIRVASRFTREQIDNVYNCLEAHPKPYYPEGLTVPPPAGTPYIHLGGCPHAASGTTPPYISHLEAEVGAASTCPTTLPCASNGAVFCDLMNRANSSAACPTLNTPYENGVGSCALQANRPPLVVPVANWYINCSEFEVKNAVTFLGGNIVAEGGVTVTGNAGILLFNTSNTNPNLSQACLTAVTGCAGESSAQAAYLYIRNGKLSTGAGATLRFNNMMVYIDKDPPTSGPSTTDRGGLNAGAQAAIEWIAPREGPFAKLLLWSESNARHTLGGAGTLQTRGIFFTPYANPFEYKGQGEDFTLSAQFIAFRMDASGQGTLTMRPLYEDTVPIRFVSSNLIR